VPLSHFNAEEWNLLTPDERVKQCRRMADEARALAQQQTEGELKRAYRELAQNWTHLADEMEKVYPR